MTDAAKNQQLRVWWIPQVPMPPFRVRVDSPKQARFLLDALAKYDDFQFRHGVKPDYSNAGGLEVFTGTVWEDWWDEETGEDIDEVQL